MVLVITFPYVTLAFVWLGSISGAPLNIFAVDAVSATVTVSRGRCGPAQTQDTHTGLQLYMYMLRHAVKEAAP